MQILVFRKPLDTTEQPVILCNKEKRLGPTIAVSLIHRAVIPPCR